GGVGDVGAPPEQEGVGVLHHGHEALADVVVPVRPGPAAVREPVVAILVRAPGGLDDAVERDELRNDELSHGSCPPVMRRRTTPADIDTPDTTAVDFSAVRSGRGGAA